MPFDMTGVKRDSSICAQDKFPFKKVAVSFISTYQKGF